MTDIFPKRQINHTTELEGINFIKSIFEKHNCIYKEINLQHDYGHDAFVGLVDGEKVLPKEIAIQIKSGQSYVNSNTCRIPSTEQHRNYWREHPLVTYGIVYDPQDECAYFTNLKNRCSELRQETGNCPILFDKHELNTITEASFGQIWLPILLGEVPKISLAKAIEWSKCADPDLAYLGTEILRRSYGDDEIAWDTFLENFLNMNSDQIPYNLIYTLAHIPGHGDIFWGKKAQWLLDGHQEKYRKKIRSFSENEIVKLIELIDEYGVDRGTVGQSCVAIIAEIPNHQKIVEKILNNAIFDKEVRFNSLCALHVLGYINDDVANDIQSTLFERLPSPE